MQPRNRAEWEASVIAEAFCFSACVFLGRGRYDTTRNLPTVQAAREEAKRLCAKHGRHGAMIYAITPSGDSAHMENFYADR